MYKDLASAIVALKTGSYLEDLDVLGSDVKAVVDSFVLDIGSVLRVGYVYYLNGKPVLQNVGVLAQLLRLGFVLTPDGESRVIVRLPE